MSSDAAVRLLASVPLFADLDEAELMLIARLLKPATFRSGNYLCRQGQAYFDTVSHCIVLEKVAERVNDDDVLHLVKVILKASGKRGVPQGVVISPVLSNI